MMKIFSGRSYEEEEKNVFDSCSSVCLSQQVAVAFLVLGRWGGRLTIATDHQIIATFAQRFLVFSSSSFLFFLLWSHAVIIPALFSLIFCSVFVRNVDCLARITRIGAIKNRRDAIF